MVSSSSLALVLGLILPAACDSYTVGIVGGGVVGGGYVQLHNCIVAPWV